jgi:hypothetical protein
MEFLTSNIEKQWEKDLVEKYPLIFREDSSRYNPMTLEETVNLRYGFECGEGWAKLIESIADVGTKLVSDLRNKSTENLESIYIHSCIVKEKFGILRWQGDYNLPKPYATLWMHYVSSMESYSSNICEVTGNFGRTRNMKNGKLAWIKTLCDEEAIKQGYDIIDEQ